VHYAPLRICRSQRNGDGKDTVWRGAQELLDCAAYTLCVPALFLSGLGGQVCQDMTEEMRIYSVLTNAIQNAGIQGFPLLNQAPIHYSFLTTVRRVIVASIQKFARPQLMKTLLSAARPAPGVKLVNFIMGG
jgi:hypothetical protein